MSPPYGNCFCAVATRSHLHAGLVLHAGLRASGNSEPLFLLVPDCKSDDLASLPSAPGLEWLSLDDFTSEIPALLPFYFDAFELSNALKAFLIRRLLATRRAVVYFDTDVYPVAPLAPVWAALEDRPVLLTPHQLTPPDPALTFTNEIEIVDQGVVNGGFTAWRSCPAALRALDWLCSRLPRFGFNARREGMFVDQKLLPLLSCYFPDDIQIWREPGANVAFWNAHERAAGHRDGRHLLENGAPILFFHLSGHRLASPNLPCIYLPPAANAEILRRSPWFARVLTNYVALARSVPAPPPPPPYPFSNYNGLALTPALRRVLFRKGALRRGDLEVVCARTIQALRMAKRRLLRLLSRA